MSEHTPEPSITEPTAEPTATQQIDTAAGSGRHPLNVGHLVMGLAFLGFVGIWAVVTGNAVSIDDLRWLLPLPWVLAGAGGLLALGLARRNRSAQP